MAYTLTYTLNSDGNSYTLSGYSGDKPTGRLVIPDTYNSKPVTIIGNNAFLSCIDLNSVTIPDSITSIGEFAFYNCSRLTRVSIGNGVTSIGEWAFNDCTDLTSVTFGENSRLTSIGESAFKGCTKLTSITIPDSVTSIADSAFYDCSSLTNITIPDNVTSIGEDAFCYCTGLMNLTIGNSLTSIGERAFGSCTSLARIEVANLNTKYHSTDNCIIETATNTLVVGCKTSIIPTDGSVTSIGNHAFSHCDGLTDIFIPDTVTSIGNSAFYFCSGLTSLTIPDSVTTIATDAFWGCSGLTSITIGSGVRSIGNGAFAYCSSLTKINMLPTTPPVIQTNILTDTIETVYVPAKSGEAYKTATNWNASANKITEFPILDLGSLLVYNNKVKEKIDSVEKEKLDKSNPNLIINSNFSINQRGQTSYSGSSIDTVDKWKTYNKITFDVATKTLTNNDASQAFFIQDNKYFNTLYEKTVTLSCLIDSVRYSTTATVASSYSSIQVIASIGTPTVKFELAYNPTRGILVQFRLNAGASAVVDECKLELGSVATPYVAPIYEEEIWKCNSVYTEPVPLSNPNLLVNGNFAINQRGQKTYTGNGYTVDAWRGGQSTSKVSVRDNGLTLSFSQEVTSGATAIQQKIDIDPLRLIGKTISISAKISYVSGKLWYCRIRYADSKGDFINQLSADILATGVVSATGVIPENTASLTFQFTTKVGTVSTLDRIMVEWAKVELGAIATQFIPPLISEELIKCKASERLDGVSCPNLTAGKADKLTDPFVIGSDTDKPQTWVTKFATMTLKAAWVSSSARFDIVDNNYANISTQPVGVEISASPTATDVILRAYVLYGNPEILKRIHISYSAVGTFPMTVDLYYVSGTTGYSSLGIKPLWQSHRNTASSLEFITTNTNVGQLPTGRTHICITDLTNYAPITRAYSATRDGAGNVIPDTYAKQNGSYANLTAGKLTSFIVKGRQTTNVGWHKAMEIKAANIGNVGGAGYSALVLVNGVRGSTGESVTPAGSSIIEIDCRADSGTKGVFIAGFLKINILNGWLNPNNICGVLSGDGTTISIYINIEKQFMQYNLTKLTEGAEGVENVNALTFIDEYYGSSVPTGAIYAQILNNASTTYTTKADELSYFSVGTTATSNNNWYEIATVPLNVGNFDAFSIVLLLNGRKIGAQMSGIVELEGRSDAENGWTYKNFKVLCGNLASTHIAYWEDTDKTIHFYLWAPSTTYAISTISAQRGNGLNITNPLTLYQPSDLQQLEGLIYGANFNHAAYDSHSNYIPDTYARKAEVSKPNLLINSDFSINQRGQTSYSGYNIYTVDRWKTLAVAAKATLTDGKWEFGIYSPDGPGSRTCICQDVEDFEKLKGKTVTASIKVNKIEEGVKGTTVLYVYDGKNNMEVPITGVGTFTVTKVVNAEANKLRVGIAGTPSATNYAITPEWIKLEVGTEATPFTPPLIAEELPKCHRYYQRYNFATNMPLPLGIARTDTTVSINFNIPKLRDTATIKFSTSGTVKLLNQNITELTLSLNQYYDGVCRMFITTSGLSAGTGILIAGNTDGYYALDAEIYEQS